MSKNSAKSNEVKKAPILSPSVESVLDSLYQTNINDSIDGKNLAYFYDSETPIKSVKSREELNIYLKGIVNNPCKFDNSKKLIDFINILMAFAKDLEYSIDLGNIDEKDKSMVLRTIDLCLSVKDLFIVDNVNVREFYLGILFSIAKQIDIQEQDMSVPAREALGQYLGDRKLLTYKGVVGMKNLHTYNLNIPFLKHSVWSDLSIEEENALFDILRLIVSVVPQDKGVSFGYSKIHTTMSGDGIVVPYVVTISFEDVAKGVNTDFLEYSLKVLIKQIKKGMLQSRDELKQSNEDGWDNISAHFYDKCQDSLYLTQKIGKKMLSVYGHFKLQKEKD